MFVYVNMNGDGTAQGYWPGPDGGTHAHDISDGCIRFLEACPNPDQVLNSLADHITPNGWSGSRADIMDRNTNALAVLVEHPDPRIAEATRRVVVEARSWIMKERDRERREDEASEQTFE